MKKITSIDINNCLLRNRIIYWKDLLNDNDVYISKYNKHIMICQYENNFILSIAEHDHNFDSNYWPDVATFLDNLYMKELSNIKEFRDIFMEDEILLDQYNHIYGRTYYV